jgi:hypothetical protein
MPIPRPMRVRPRLGILSARRFVCVCRKRMRNAQASLLTIQFRGMACSGITVMRRSALAEME